MKKIISLVLTIVLSVSTFAITAPPVSADTSFSSSLSDGSAVDKVIEQRLGELINVFANKYFTVNGDGCRAWESGHYCGNCYNRSVIIEDHFINDAKKLSWIDDTAARTIRDKIPYSFFTDDYAVYGSGWSCQGYGAICVSLLFSDTTDSALTTNHLGTYWYSYNSIKDIVKVGDIVRLNTTHTAIVLDISSEGLRVLQNNYDTSYPNCRTTVNTIPFRGRYSTISIDRILTRNNVHVCEYSDIGVCTCNAKDYIIDFYSSSNGTYTCKWFYSNLAIYSAPYSASQIVSQTGKTVRVLGSTVNHHSNTWYAVEYLSENSCEIGFVYSGNLSNNYLKTANCTPVKPTINNGKAVRNDGSSSTATISWSSSGGSIAKYIVEYSSNGSVWYTDPDYKTPLATTYTSTNLWRDLTFKVTAISPSGEKSDPYLIYYTHNASNGSNTSNNATSNEVQITSGFASRNGKSSTAQISWDYIGDVSYFKVQYSRDKITWYTDADYKNNTNSSYTTTDLVRSLYFKIIPVTSTGVEGSPYIIYYQH